MSIKLFDEDKYFYEPKLDCIEDGDLPGQKKMYWSDGVVTTENIDGRFSWLLQDPPKRIQSVEDCLFTSSKKVTWSNGDVTYFDPTEQMVRSTQVNSQINDLLRELSDDESVSAALQEYRSHLFFDGSNKDQSYVARSLRHRDYDQELLEKLQDIKDDNSGIIGFHRKMQRWEMKRFYAELAGKKLVF